MSNHNISYIRGIRLEVGLDGLTVMAGPGVCFVPGPRRITSDGSAQVTLSNPDASTWYHAYAFRGPSTSLLSLEVVKTAPSDIYRGAARTKQGDETRRYLGSMFVGADRRIRPFKHTQIGDFGNKILFDANAATGSVPQPILQAFTNSASQTIQLNPIVPATSTTALLTIANMSNRQVYISRPGLPAASSNNFQMTVLPNESATADVMLDSQQRFTVVLSSQGLLGAILNLLSGSVNIYSQGYYFDR